MDIGTIVGIAAGFAIAILGMGETVCLCGDWYALIVVGLGGFAATVASFPLTVTGNLLRVIAAAVFSPYKKPQALIPQVVGMAETARRLGILALEEKAKQVKDQFLSAGIRLAVDGTEPDLIMDILETELRFIEERHRQSFRLLKRLGWNWMIFGGVGIALLLIVRGDDGIGGMELVRQLGYPLLYGLLLAGLVAWPLARKLRELSEREMLSKRMVIEGVMSIQSGDNPRIVEHKLSVFVAPKYRPSGKAPMAPEMAPEPGPVEDGTVEKMAEFVEERRGRVLELVRERLAGEALDEEERRMVEGMAEKVEKGKVELVGLLAALSREMLEEVLEEASRPPLPPPLQRQVLEAGLAFGDLASMSDEEVQTLLRQVDQRDLAYALKGAGRQVREKMLSGMSERVRGFIMEEMGFIHPRPQEVLETQARILKQVYLLVEREMIRMPQRA